MAETVASAPYEHGAPPARRLSYIPPNSVARHSPRGTFLFPKLKELHVTDIDIFDDVRAKIAKGENATLATFVKDYGTHVNGLDIVKLALGVAQPDCVLKYINREQELTAKGKDCPGNLRNLDEKRARFRKHFAEKMLKRGFILEHEQDKMDPAQRYIKVYATFDLLLRQAEKIQLRMRLAEVKPMERKPKRTDTLVDRLNKIGMLDLLFGERKPRYASAIFEVERYKEFMGSDRPPISSTTIGSGDGYPTKEETFFSQAVRSLLVHTALCRTKTSAESWDEGKSNSCTFAEVLQYEVFTKYYFVHDGKYDMPPDTSVRAFLFHNWVKSGRRQPLDVVRDYLGEKIALYYGWLGFYTSWLGFASIVGVIVFLYGLGAASSAGTFSFERVFDNELSGPFALFMSIWSTLFLEFWKRENARLNVRWNTYDFEQNEPNRPQFVHSKTRISPVTGKCEEVYPRSLRLVKLATSTIAVTLSISMLCLIVFAITIFRPWIRNKYKGTDTPIPSVLTALLSLVLIRVASMTYVRLAVWLTDWENHRTDTEHEDALIFKRYLFEFVNYYSSLFYVAIIKQWAGRRILGDPELNDLCGFNGSCLSDLMIQLAIVFVGNQLVGQIMEVGIPYAKVKWQRKQAEKAKEERLQTWRNANQEATNTGDLPQYIDDDLLEPAGTVFDEYSEMVIQFGFCSLFVASFPLAPLFAFLNNVTEIRTDAYKTITQTQRPPGFRAQDLGSWEIILGVVSKLSVITNALIIAFASKTTRMQLGSMFGWDNETDLKPNLGSQLGFVLVFEHVVLLLKMVAEYLVPDVPETVKDIMDRDAFLEETYKAKKADWDRGKSRSQQALDESRAKERPAEVVVQA